MSKPTESGSYWLQIPSTSMITKEITWVSDPEVVYVAMGYTHRNKVVPYVLGRFWKDPLERIPENARWSPKPLQPDCA